MKKTIAVIVLVLVILSLAVAADLIQFRRGNAADRSTGSSGEPLWDKDSLTLWMGSDSGNVPIGGRFMAYQYHSYAADAGANDTYVITLPNFDLPSYVTGMLISFKANTVNTGAATININSLGAKAITKNGTTALSDGDIAAGSIVTLRYDGTQFQLQGTVFAFNQDIVPTAANTYDLGSSTYPADTGYAKSWKETGHEAKNNFLVVPNIQGLSHSGTGNAFGASLNDTITFFAVYLEKAIVLGEVSIGTGTLGGSCATRTWGVAFYNSSFALIDTTAATAWPGNGTGGTGAFVNNATAGPGLVYVAFTTYNNASCSQVFRGPDLSTNTVFSGMISSFSTSYPTVGYATETLDLGIGWPATITPNKATTAVLFPNLYIVGSNLD